MQAKLKQVIPHEVEIPLSGYDLACLFWELCADEQALFFHKMGEFEGLPFQLSAVSQSNSMTYQARRMMAMIGEYSQEPTP